MIYPKDPNAKRKAREIKKRLKIDDPLWDSKLVRDLVEWIASQTPGLPPGYRFEIRSPKGYNRRDWGGRGGGREGWCWVDRRSDWIRSLFEDGKGFLYKDTRFKHSREFRFETIFEILIFIVAHEMAHSAPYGNPDNFEKTRKSKWMRGGRETICDSSRMERNCNAHGYAVVEKWRTIRNGWIRSRPFWYRRKKYERELPKMAAIDAVTKTTPTDGSEKIGASLRSLREARGVTQGQVSIGTGITQPKISGYEQGGIIPVIGALITLADYYKVPLDELIGREVPD